MNDSGWIEKIRRWPHSLSLLVAMLVFVLLTFFWFQLSQWYQTRLINEQRAEVAVQTSLQANSLSLSISRRIARLQGLHAFVQALNVIEGSLLRAEFDQFVAELYAGSKGIRNLAVAPDSVVRFIYPLEGNETVIGYEPLKDSREQVKSDTIEAIETGRIILSGPLELLQGGEGLIARQAVYRDGEYWGLVNIVLDWRAILAETGLDNQADELDSALRDGVGRVLYGQESVFEHNPVVGSVELTDGFWELASAPREGWEATVRQPLLILQITAMIIIVLLSGLVYLTLNRQTQLARAVNQRTEELALANEQLEQRVERRSRQLAEHARRLAVMEERQRIARELHDSVSQALYGIALGAKTARTILERDPPQAVEPLEYIVSLADAGLAEMRALIFELRPDSLEKEGLAAALSKQAASIKARHHLVVLTELDPEPDLSLEVKEALYRIAQEALQNVIKHAQASTITIALKDHGREVVLQVRDDGAGFEPAGQYPGHLGLQTMQERTNRLGGRLEIVSNHGQGTLIRVSMPYRPESG
ncbi:MAG: CHASE domain-containing protein [Anaerolineales bacterium]|nr:CHASE domain-containing protein [Anaerolineales bacterium]